VARALDERLVEAAPPAETEVEEPGVADGGGEGEGEVEDSAPSGEEEEEEEPARAPVRSRRRQEEEEEEAAPGHDRFKLINGKEVVAPHRGLL
jgi:hypothetical protein